MFRLAQDLILHPISLSVPLKTGLSWTGGGAWVYDEKVDGWRSFILDGACYFRSRQNSFIVPASLNNCWIDGELAGGVFHAFDLMKIHGQDIRNEPLSFRKAALIDLLKTLPKSSKIIGVKSGSGGEFLDAILNQGGEGVVAKHRESLYGEPESWVKCKRQETHDCIVTDVHSVKKSVRIELEGIDCGWCGIPVSKFKSINRGNCIEVSCHSIHPSGKLREPVFIRPRPDKD